MNIKNTKKILYTTSIAGLITLLISTSVFGAYEWRTIGGGKFVDGTNPLHATYTAGNVGIGTIAPTQPLQVNGANAQPATSGTTSNAILRVRGGSNHSLDFGTQANAPYGAWIQSVDHTNLSSNLPFVLNPNGGNVGIGTSNPSEALDVVGNIQAGKGSGGVALTVNDGGGNANVTFNHANQTPEQNGNAGRITVNTDSTSGGYMEFELSDNQTAGVSGGLGNAMILYTGGDLRVYGAFENSSGQSIRDAGGGWVRTYGNTGWYNGTYGGGWYMIDSTWIRSYANKSVYVNNTIRADTFEYDSDRNLKTNIADLLNASDILNIVPKTFDWKDSDNKKNAVNDIGVIAQDVEKYFPQFVGEDPETGNKSVDYPKLVVPLIDVVKKQQEEIDSLKAEIAEIKTLLK